MIIELFAVSPVIVIVPDATVIVTSPLRSVRFSRCSKKELSLILLAGDLIPLRIVYPFQLIHLFTNLPTHLLWAMPYAHLGIGLGFQSAIFIGEIYGRTWNIPEKMAPFPLGHTQYFYPDAKIHRESD